MKEIPFKILTSIIGLIGYLFLAVGSGNSPSDKLEFVGRIENLQNKPVNNRLVIAYLNGKEVGRGKTHLGKYEAFEKFPNDGLFSVETPNNYELKELELDDTGYSNGSLGKVGSGMDLKLGSRTYVDFGTIQEGNDAVMWVNARKNVKYTVKVLPGEYESLPFDIQNGINKTVLSKSGKIVVVTDQGVPKVDIRDVSFTSQIEEIKIKEIDSPLNNCLGNSELRQRYTSSESYLHETNFNLQAKGKVRLPALWLLGIDLSTQLEGKYGFSEREFSSQTLEYEFIAKPRTNVNYKIIWYEVWQYGQVKVEAEEGLVTVPFKVKTKLKYIIETERKRCR